MSSPSDDPIVEFSSQSQEPSSSSLFAPRPTRPRTRSAAAAKMTRTSDDPPRRQDVEASADRGGSSRDKVGDNDSMTNPTNDAEASAAMDTFLEAAATTARTDDGEEGRASASSTSFATAAMEAEEANESRPDEARRGLGLPAPLERFFAAANKKNRKPAADNKGAEALTRLMKQAAYEAYVDPYRGMLIPDADPGDGNGDDATLDDEDACSPWKGRCQVNLNRKREDDGKAPQEGTTWRSWLPIAPAAAPTPPRSLVQKLTHTSCPCLEQWTLELTARAKKRRADLVVGGRVLGDCSLGLRVPVDGSAAPGSADDDDNKARLDTVVPASSSSEEEKSQVLRCACDYNPFCLLTMGGAMNALLVDAERSATAAATATTTTTSKADAPEAVHDYRDVDANQRLLDDTAKYFTKAQLDVTSPLCIYGSDTKKRIGTARTSILVPERSVRDYLQGTLHSLTSVLSLDECIRTLKERHSRLVFHNPLVIKEPDVMEVEPGEDKDMICLALPPGIENLGATCYLNTQLQCLAQCLVFLSGVFQWRPDPEPGSNGGDGAECTPSAMQKVLLLFQRLLANLHAGGNRTYTTTEFSDALGLDHFEQQDPNEFSRLFLERMNESFQQADGKGCDEYNLKDLLSHLFQGNMCYETTCTKCRSRSYRRETFRDLNLPIVDPPKVEKSKRSILELLGSPSKDATVQDCLNSYCQPEDLKGDNQYFCAVCNEKRDASRQVSFTNLPPVLNIQLCRYVFDRKSLSKKKLSDNVLLPVELMVQSRESPEERKEAPSSLSSSANAATKSTGATPAVTETTHRYVLCAVMRHQGNSAYSGHYVAEAMDWATGQWYEFNDQKVTHLESGPSCSERPTPAKPTTSKSPQWNNIATGAGSSGNDSNDKKGAGSKDAYNLYYVDESFLAQSIVDDLRQERVETASQEKPNQIKVGILADEGKLQQSVFENIVTQRIASFADLERMCLRDGDAFRRKMEHYIRLRASVIPDLEALKASPTPEAIWIPSDTLRSFFELDFSQPLATPRTLLCSHENPGLHPRIARRGKLLPRGMFTALANFVETDSEELVQAENPHVVITPTSNMECQTCREEYCNEIEKKLLVVAAMKELYDLCDPKVQPISLEFDDSTLPTNENERFAYVISRAFMNSYRKAFSNFMKTMSETESMIDISKQQMKGGGAIECSAEGLDAFPIARSSELTANDQNILDTMERQVNSCLTCPHGRFTDRNPKLYRHISYKDWDLVQSIFPKAICFREPMRLKGESRNEDEIVCTECEAEESADDNQLRRIKELAECTKDNKLSVVGLEMAVASSYEPKTYRLLHRDDVDAWNRFISSFDGKGRGARTARRASSILAPKVSCARKLFACDNRPNLGLSDQRLELLASFLRPFVCERHGKPIDGAMFQRVSSGNATRWKLSNRVAIVEQEAYDEYIANLAIVVIILSPLGEYADPSNRTLAEDSSDADEFVSEFKLLDTLHPSIEKPTHDLSTATDAHYREFEPVGNQRVSKVLRDLSERTCSDPECCSRFAAWNLAEYGNDTAISTTGTRCESMIVVDSDVEEVVDPTFPVRVFEVEADANVEDQFQNLAQCAGAAINGDVLTSDLPFIRRSRRKRKAIYPVGAVKGDEMIQTKLAHNLAAVRLTLMQSCEEFELNHSLKGFALRPDPFDVPVEESVVFSYNGPSRMIATNLIDLSFELNHQTLQEVCESLLKEALGASFNPTEQFFIVRQRSIDETSLEANHEELVEVLIEASNNKDAAASKSGGRVGRCKAPERGFTGTLLTGTARDESAKEDESKPEAAVAIAPRAEDAASLRVVSKGRTGEGHSDVVLRPPPRANDPSGASAVVVLDDDDDQDVEPRVKDGPTGNNSRRLRPSRSSSPHREALPPGASTAHYIHVADSDSSDDSFLLRDRGLGRPAKRTFGKGAAAIASAGAPRGASDKESLAVAVANALSREYPAHEFNDLLLAATFAVDKNPEGVKVDTLVSIAQVQLAKMKGRL